MHTCTTFTGHGTVVYTNYDAAYLLVLSSRELAGKITETAELCETSKI